MGKWSYYKRMKRSRWVRRSWASMSPEERAERIARMQRGRMYNKKLGALEHYTPIAGNNGPLEVTPITKEKAAALLEKRSFTYGQYAPLRDALDKLKVGESVLVKTKKVINIAAYSSTSLKKEKGKQFRHRRIAQGKPEWVVTRKR